MIHVEQRPEQEALLGTAVLGALQLEAPRSPRCRSESLAVLRRVPDGDDPARAHDDVDLVALEVVAVELAVVHRHWK